MSSNARYPLNGDAGFANLFGSSARSKQSDALRVKTLGELEQAGLVVHGKKGYNDSRYFLIFACRTRGCLPMGGEDMVDAKTCPMSDRVFFESGSRLDPGIQLSPIYHSPSCKLNCARYGQPGHSSTRQTNVNISIPFRSCLFSTIATPRRVRSRSTTSLGIRPKGLLVVKFSSRELVAVALNLRKVLSYAI